MAIKDTIKCGQCNAHMKPEYADDFVIRSCPFCGSLFEQPVIVFGDIEGTYMMRTPRRVDQPTGEPLDEETLKAVKAKIRELFAFKEAIPKSYKRTIERRAWVSEIANALEVKTEADRMICAACGADLNEDTAFKHFDVCPAIEWIPNLDSMGYPMKCDVCGVVYDSDTREGVKQMHEHYKECPNAWWRSPKNVTVASITEMEKKILEHYRRFGQGRKPKDARTFH